MPSPKKDPKDHQFRIVKEELSYSRYLNVFNRVVQYPLIRSDKCSQAEEKEPEPTVVEYDIVSSRTVSFHFCTIFPFNVHKKTVTIIKEYAQGANDFLYGIPSGGLSEKHDSLEDCAWKELSEEAHLRGGTMIKLIPEDHPGILEVKWCRNRFTPFLILNPEEDPAPLSHDLEEVIEVMNVDLATLKDIMYGGYMMLPSMVTCNMALKYLEEKNII